MESDRASKRQRYNRNDDSGYKRRREDDFSDVTAGWRSLLLHLGDHCKEYNFITDANKHLETCSGILRRELSSVAGDAVPMLLQCAEELPHKAPMYATLVGLLNEEDSDFAAQIVEQTGAGLQSALDTGDRNKIRLLLRFLSLLFVTHVVSPATVVDVYDFLLTAAVAIVDEDGGNPAWQPRADFYVLCVLAALPFCSIELSQQAGEELERLLAAVDAYMSLRTTVHHAALQCLQPFSNTTYEDPLEDLLVRIRALQQSQWKADSVWRTHDDFQEKLIAAPFREMAALSRPPVPALPSPATALSLERQRFQALEEYPPRVGRLKIFPPSKTDDTMSPMDRFIVEEYILDVLFYLNGCRKECATYLVGLPVPFRYEYITAETIFSQLFRLPNSPSRLVYYTIVIVDLCKALPGAFPAVVASAVKLLFDRMAMLDVECRSRLVQWLSHHLSNFQFIWPWDNWAHVLDKPPWHPQRLFISEVLEKEIRLSYWEKVKETLGSERMAVLLPPKPVPQFKYDSAKEGIASEAEVALSKELVQKVRSKSTVKDMWAWLDESVTPTVGPLRALDLTVQTLLNLGAKSFTHTMTALERYGQLLHKMAPTQEKQVALLESAVELWQSSSQMAAVVVDRCMAFRIVSNLAIVQWVFLPSCQRLFQVSDRVWEVLRNAINKTNNRTKDLRKEVFSVQKVAAAAAAASSKAKEEAEAAWALVENAAEEEAKSQATAKAEWAKGKAEKAAEEATSAQDAAEAKEFLLKRALGEQESLFMAVLGNFTSLLTARLAAMDAAEASVVDAPAETGGEAPADEGAAAMETEGERGPAENEGGDVEMNAEEGNGRGPNRKERERKYEGGTNHIVANGDARKNVMEDGKIRGEEEKAWVEFTLAQFRSICRHYAAEIWPWMEKIDSEVFTKEVDARVLEAAYQGLGRQAEVQ